jgi:predicted permease
MMPRLAALATRIYVGALFVLPRALRDRYGDDMRATFADRCAGASARGGAAVVALLARELVDLVAASARERRRPQIIEQWQAPSRLRSLGDLSPLVPQPPSPLSMHGRSATMGSLQSDLRYAVRMLRRQPGFTVVAVLTLALGIGATTAVFTIVNGVLLRPLPFADPDRLLVLLNGRNGRVSTSYSPANYRDVTTQSGVFSGAAAFDVSSMNLTGQGNPRRVRAATVTGAFFPVLGVMPRLGRVLQDADVDGARQVIVLSDPMWRSQFGGRPDIVGAIVRLDGKPFEIVGVAPPELSFPDGPDFWRPLVFTPHQVSDDQRGANWINVIARLRPDVTVALANSSMGLVADRLARDFPRSNAGKTMFAAPLHERLVRGVRPALLVLLGAVSLVLLIACVNVANLLLARACARTREVAVRAAIGAGRTRLVLQFLAESLVLGAVGAAGGLAVAWSTTRALVALAPPALSRFASLAIDVRVLAFAATIAIATSVLFGLVPALSVTRGRFAAAIGSASRSAIGGSGARVRKTLVTCEMALAVVLLVGAGLLLRSYQRLSGVDPGFSADRVLTFHLSLPEEKYSTGASVYEFFTAYVDRLAGSPGVENAAAVFGLPLDSDFSASSSFTRRGEADSANAPTAGIRVVTPGYFDTLRIPLRAGRLFNAHDDPSGAEVVLINEECARRYWPNANPIGQDVHLGVRLVGGVRSGQKTIVGIVGDVKFGGLDLTAPPEIYMPYAQHPVDGLTIAVRTTGEPAGIVPTARAELAALDPELPLTDTRSMAELVGQSIAGRRFTMVLLGSFAAVAVLLAAIGVYGVLAYVVSQRTQEIGVRLAIGAAPADVVGLFLREGVMLVVLGLAAGLAGAAAAARALTTLLFGVTTTDPITFGGVAGTLALVALLASYVPARRAARVDPVTALRRD